MSSNNKEYTAKLKSFTVLGWIILAAGLIYLFQALNSHVPDAFRQAMPGGFVTVLFGLAFLFFGTKSRKVVLSADSIEYWASGKKFEAAWHDVAALKTMKEPKRKSENLVILTESEKILTISSAWFAPEKLKEVFRDMAALAASHPEITIEDDCNWLK